MAQLPVRVYFRKYLSRDIQCHYFLSVYVPGKAPGAGITASTAVLRLHTGRQLVFCILQGFTMYASSYQTVMNLL